MKKIKTPPTPLQQRFLDQLQPLWPALKGSLALAYKPCTRPHCPACARGDKHPNYLLAFTQAGRRRCLYVPKPMVPVLRRALHHGRQIERLLYAMGPSLLREYRAQNPAKTGPAAQLRRKRTPPQSEWH